VSYSDLVMGIAFLGLVLLPATLVLTLFVVALTND
jgi:hypothetical protein